MGIYNNLLEVLRSESIGNYKNLLRMCEILTTSFVKFLYPPETVFHSDSLARKEFINFSVSTLKLFCLEISIIYTHMIRK